jgi:hypothetical protein
MSEVTRVGIFDMQVCVPAEWTDEQVERFANSMNPAGTEHGWTIRRADNPAQNGAPERVVCAQDPARVHIMLEC